MTKQIDNITGEVSEWGGVALELLYWSTKGLQVPAPYAPQLWERAEPHIPELRARSVDSLLYLGCNQRVPSQRVYDKVWDKQREVLLDVLSTLERYGIQPLIFKGAEFCAGYYKNRSLGFLSDIDLLVDRKLLGAVKRLLFLQGLSQAVYNPALQALADRDIPEVARLEASQYELSPLVCLQEIELDGEELSFAREYNRHPIWVADDRCHVVVEINVYYQLAADVENGDILNRAIPSSLGRGLTMSREDHLWFLTSRYYNEVALHGKRSLRDFAYLAALLDDDKFDWRIITGQAKKYDLEAPLYYFLSFLSRLSGKMIPREVLSELLPTRNRQSDWGWQLSKLFGGIEPFYLQPTLDSFRFVD